MSKSSKACDISPKVRKEVKERDRCCIVCGSYSMLQIAHYISRARLGLGIPQNLGVMCVYCHIEYDNGSLHNEIKKRFEEHLQAHYPDWDKSKLTYRKWNCDTGTKGP